MIVSVIGGAIKGMWAALRNLKFAEFPRSHVFVDLEKNATSTRPRTQSQKNPQFHEDCAQVVLRPMLYVVDPISPHCASVRSVFLALNG